MNRTELALLACEGMTDEDLMKRGQSAFPKMIDRKRHYSKAARVMAAQNEILKRQLTKALKELETAKTSLSMLKPLDAAIIDTSEAKSILKGFASAAMKDAGQ